jgi:hypothetical protein
MPFVQTQEANDGHKKTMDTEGYRKDEAEGNRRRVWQGHYEEDCSREAQRWISEETRCIRREYAEDCTTQKEEVTRWRGDAERYGFRHHAQQQPRDAEQDADAKAKGGYSDGMDHQTKTA